MCERKIDTELDCFANDFGFRELDQGRVNLEVSAFKAGFGRKIGQLLKRFDEFRAAIGITAVVNRICADENVTGWNRFCIEWPAPFPWARGRCRR